MKRKSTKEKVTISYLHSKLSSLTCCNTSSTLCLFLWLRILIPSHPVILNLHISTNSCPLHSPVQANISPSKTPAKTPHPYPQAAPKQLVQLGISHNCTDSSPFKLVTSNLTWPRNPNNCPGNLAFLLFKKIFINLSGLCWVFIAVWALQLQRAGGYSLVLCTGFFALLTLHGRLLFWSMGSRAHGLQQSWHAGSVAVASRLWSTGSVAVMHGFSGSAACGIFSDQGWNSCLLHWQVGSLPLSQQVSPCFPTFKDNNFI